MPNNKGKTIIKETKRGLIVKPCQKCGVNFWATKRMRVCNKCKNH